MKSKLYIISDLPLLIFASLGSVAYTIACLVIINVVSFEGVVRNQDQVFLIQMIFIVLLLILLFAITASIVQSVCMLVLTKDSVQVVSPFQRRAYTSYSEFSHIYLGCYFHGSITGVGTWRHYIVFSKEHIPESTLLRINKVKNSDRFFKILYTQKNYKKMRNILPLRYCNKIDFLLKKAGLE